MSETAFTTPVNFPPTTLLLAYTAGSSTTMTLATGQGAALAAALVAQGLPSISTSAPLRFKMTPNAALVTQTGQIAASPAYTIYKATGLSGDDLSGLSVLEGTTDQDFFPGDEFSIEDTAGAEYAQNVAINALEDGSTSPPNITSAITDKGGQVYNVEAYSLVGDGLIFTANGTATQSTIQVLGTVPSQSNVGNTITIVGAGTAAATIKTTITAYAETDLIGSISSSTNTLTLTTSAGSPAVGSPIVVRGAGNSGSDLHTTVSGGSGTSLTLTANATTTVIAANVILNATFTLNTPIVTTVTGAAARCGTDNRAALSAMATLLRPRPQDVYFPTILFPLGKFLFDLDLAASTQINIGGLTIAGAGGQSQIATFDSPTVSAQYLFSASQRVTFRDITFNWGANNDPNNFSCGLFHSQSAVGLGNGSRVFFFDCIATGSAAPLVYLQRDDLCELHGCDISALEGIFHDGPNSAGQSQGMVRVFGGYIQGFGLASDNHLHGIYLRNGVSCDINTTFRNQVASSTSFGIQIDGGAGTAASIKIRSKFESTVIKGIITSDTGTTIIDGSSFATSLAAITCQAAVVVTNCDFNGCGAEPIDDFTNTGSTLVITGNRFFDAFPAVKTDITGWSVKFNDNYLSQRTSANALSLTTPTAVQAANNWFSDGTYYGQLPTASLTSGFAALAGPGTTYWDTTLGTSKVSTGATWLSEVQSGAGITGGTTIIGGTAAADPLTLQGSSHASGGPINLSFVTPTGGSWTSSNFSAGGDLAVIKTTNQTVTGAAFRQAGAVLQDGSTNTGADLTLSTLWTAFQFTASFTDTVVIVAVQLKRSGTIANTAGTIQALLYTDSAGQPGAAIATSSPLPAAYFNYGTSYASLVLRTGTGQALTNGTLYWLVLQESAAPSGANILANVATSNNTNVATGANGTVWSVAAGPMAFFQIFGRHGTGISGQTTSAVAGAFTSTTAGAITGTSTLDTAVTGTSTYRTGGNFTSTAGVGCAGTSTAGTGGQFQTRDGIGCSVLQTGSLVANVATAGIFITRSQTLGGFGCTGPMIGCNTTIADTGNLLDLQKGGTTQFGVSHDGHVLSGGTLPTKTAGAGAGTTPTITVVAGSTDFRGRISVLTGTSPTASTTVVTLNFAVAFASAPFCRIVPVNGAAAALSGNAAVWADSASVTVNGFAILVGSTNLAAATTYLWDYEVIG